MCRQTDPNLLRGIGLVELLIAMALSSVLSLALFEVFKVAKHASVQVVGANEMLDRAQLSFALFEDSVNMAGFWSGVQTQNLDLISNQLSAFPGECDNAWVLNLEQRLQGYDGAETANTISSLPINCLSKDYVPHSDVLVVRRASAVDSIPESQLRTRYYRKRFIVRGSSGSGGVVFQGRDVDRAMELVPTSVFPNNWLLSVDMYFLEYCRDMSSCGESGVGLSRYTLTGNRFVKQRLVNGVAQLQFEYGLDINRDGLVDRYTEANDVTAWNAVRSVRVFALLKGEEASYTNEGVAEEFTLGSGFEVRQDVLDPRFKYRKFQSEFSLKNV